MSTLGNHGRLMEFEAGNWQATLMGICDFVGGDGAEGCFDARCSIMLK